MKDWTLNEVVEFLMATEKSFIELQYDLGEEMEREIVNDYDRFMDAVVGEFLQRMTEKERKELILMFVDYGVV